MKRREKEWVVGWRVGNAMQTPALMWPPPPCHPPGGGCPLQSACHWYPSHYDSACFTSGLPWWLSQYRILLQCGRPGFDPWVGKIPRRRAWQPSPVFLGFPGGSVGKDFICNVGDLGSIPGSGRSPGEGRGSPLQDSGLAYEPSWQTRWPR